MKKYGRQRQHQHGYTDFGFLGKHTGPWWLNNHNGKSKKIARREAKEEIKGELYVQRM